jgi:hypothetical protein
MYFIFQVKDKLYHGQSNMHLRKRLLIVPWAHLTIDDEYVFFVHDFPFATRIGDCNKTCSSLIFLFSHCFVTCQY